ncbi:hypothetical protein [Archaeoglobus sp. UBA231]|jgi:hypothetical protein|nr:hypothetical protein [Archaeoglobus sp. UBA231]
MLEIAEDVISVLRRFGIKEIRIFEVSGSSAEEIEKKFKADYDNAIVNVLKIGDSYRVEVFILDEGLDDVRKSALESYLYLSGLERFAIASGNDDFRYLVQRFVRADKKLLNLML